MVKIRAAVSPINTKEKGIRFFPFRNVIAIMVIINATARASSGNRLDRLMIIPELTYV